MRDKIIRANEEVLETVYLLRDLILKSIDESDITHRDIIFSALGMSILDILVHGVEKEHHQYYVDSIHEMLIWNLKDKGIL